MKKTSIVLFAAAVVVLTVFLIGCEEPPVGPQTGTIKVTSFPSGARVFFDGSDTGRVTPYTIPEVSAGSHTVRLTLDGYLDWGPQSVSVISGDTATVNATLEPTKQPPPEPEPVPERETGLVLMDVEAYRDATILRADPIAVLPKSVDLSIDTPQPGNQGGQGSCVGWAVAYALKSYHERVERGWALNDHRHVMSPAYLYNQIKVPQGGAYISAAFDVLMEQGVSSWSLMPYDPSDDDRLPSAAARAEAADYRIAEWGTVLRSGAFVRELKSHLAGGSPIVIAMPVYSDFDLLSESNPVYDDNRGDRRGYHAVTIVGYDDGWSAFKIINSWGTNWGLGGYGWIDYEAVSWALLETYVARDRVALPDDEPPEAATDPVPADGTTGVAVDTVLSWTRNSRTTSFDVYLGPSSTLTAVDLQGAVAQPTFSPTLAPGATYYWRVDARGAGGVTAGSVWSFTTVESPPPPPEPPVIVMYPAPITFSSPSATATTRTLSDYIRGATRYEVQANPAGIVTTRVAGHRLTIAPQAAGTTEVRMRGTNEDGSSPWLSMNVTVTSQSPPPPPEPGTAWRAVDSGLPDRDISGWLTSVAWNGSRFVAVGHTGTVLHSRDGTIWSRGFTDNSEMDLSDVTWNGSRFVAVGNYEMPCSVSSADCWASAILYSDDGVTWNRADHRIDRRTSISQVVVTDTRTVAFGWGPEPIIVWHSPDGKSWREVWRGDIGEGNILNVVWDGQRLVTVRGEGASARYSTDDGITWIAAGRPVTTIIEDIAWNGQRYVAVGVESRGTCEGLEFGRCWRSIIWHSRDGASWAKVSVDGSDGLQAVTWGNGRFVAVGQAGTVLYSQDGITWSEAQSPTPYYLQAVTWSGARFVAVGFAGTILVSP